MLKDELSNEGILTLTMASPPANSLLEEMLEAQAAFLALLSFSGRWAQLA